LFFLAFNLQANGRLQCLGSAQHLKSKFGTGYQLELKVQNVSHADSDFEHYAVELEHTKPWSVDHAYPHDAYELSFNVDEATAALERLTGDDSLSQMIHAQDPVGFTVWNDASSPGGVDLAALAAFATCELRMRKLELFIGMKFPKHVLRERQDTKARYEVDCAGIKISTIFACIEQNKDDLRLADYSVSQTSLEQVFNMHAAEAERLKLHQIDG
jgi:ATP-binding cassette, subfamily A (ABC1), member 3